MLHDYVRELKAKTDAGAVLLLDGELHVKFKWLISKRRIAIKETSPSATVTYGIWDACESTPEEAEEWLRDNVRVLVDAK